LREEFISAAVPSKKRPHPAERRERGGLSVNPRREKGEKRRERSEGKERRTNQ